MNEVLDFDFATPSLSPVETLRHSAAHLLASAVAELYPGARFGTGPNIEHGFYYDIELPEASASKTKTRVGKFFVRRLGLVREAS